MLLMLSYESLLSRNLCSEPLIYVQAEVDHCKMERPIPPKTYDAIIVTLGIYNSLGMERVHSAS